MTKQLTEVEHANKQTMRARTREGENDQNGLERERERVGGGFNWNTKVNKARGRQTGERTEGEIERERTMPKGILEDESIGLLSHEFHHHQRHQFGVILRV